MATDGGEVQVRLSVAGGDEVLVTLQRLREETEKLPQATEPAVSGFTKLAEQIRGFKDLAMFGQLGMIVTGLSEVAKAVEEVTKKLVDAAKTMADWIVTTIKARAEMEQFEIRLAAVHIRTSEWNAAMLGGIDTASKLEYMGGRTVQSLGGLVSAFTQLQRMTMNSDQATLQLTEHLAVLSKIAGSSTEAIVSTISRAALTGNLPTRSEVGRMLAIMGFTGEDIKDAYEAGKLFEYLESKMGDLGKAAEELKNSWQGIMGGLRVVGDQTKDQLGTVWEPLKLVFATLRDIGESDGFKLLVEGVSKIGQYLVADQVRKLAAQVAYLQGLIQNAGGGGPLDAAGAAGVLYGGYIAEWPEVGLDEKTKALQKQRQQKNLEDLKRGLKAGEASLTKIDPSVIDEMFKEADREHSLAGLKDLDRVLAEIEARADRQIERFKKGGGGLLPTDEEIRRYTDTVRSTEAIRKGEAVDADAEKRLEERLRLEARAATRTTAMLEEQRGKDLQLQRAYYSTLDQFAQASARGELETLQLSYRQRENQLTQHLSDMTDRIRRAVTAEATVDEKTGLLGVAADFIGPMRQEDLDRIRQANAMLLGLRADHSRALLALDEERRLNENIILKKQEEDWEGYYAALREKRIAFKDFSFSALQDDQREAAQKAAENAQTGAQGIAAGLMIIYTEIKSFGQDTVEFMTTVWRDIGKTFEDTFYSIFTGKFSSIEDIFKSLFDSILKEWSRMLSQMLTRWLVTGDAMGNGQGSGGILGGLFKGFGKGQTGYGANFGTSGLTGEELDLMTGEELDAYRGSGGVGGGAGLGQYGAYAAYAYGAYQGISSIFTPRTTSQPTYQGQYLGQTADFGGPGGGQAYGAAALVATAAAVATAAEAVAVGATMVEAATAAAGASVVPLVGWIVAAALLIVGILMTVFAGQEEGHIYVAIKDAFEKSGARNVIGEFVKGIMDTTGNYIVDLATAAGKEGDAGKFVKAYQEQFKKIWGSARFDIAAGSPEDLQKDVENFFSRVLPKFAMQAAFGQIGFGMPPGDRDWQGGLAGVDFNTLNSYMDAQGNWIKRQLYDPEAPIPAMLLGLDFTAARVEEIANKLANASDMEAFKKWLLDLVEVVVTMREFVTKLGWSSAEVMADITATANKTPAQQFAERATNLAALAEQLQYYVGDEQIAKAKELNGLVAQYWADQEATIKSLMDMAEQFHQLILDTTEAMGLALEKMRAVKGGGTEIDWSVSDILERLFGPGKSYGSTIAPGPGMGTAVYGMFGAIEAEADPVKAATMAKEAIALINQVFTTLLQRLQEIWDLQKQNDQLVRAFNQNAIELWYAPGQPGQLGTGTTTSDMAFMLNKAQTTSGQEQLNWIARLQNAAAARYEDELRAIKAIQDSMKELRRSVEQQKWDFRYEMAGIADESNPLGHVQQGGMLMERIQKLMGRLGGAVSTEEVNQITGEIQGLVGQYWQMSDKSQGAFEFVSKILDAMQTAADKRFGELFAKVTEDNDRIYQMLVTAGTLLGEAEETVSDALDDLRDSVEALDTLFKTKFQHSIDEIIESNGGLSTALSAAIPFFTKAATELGGEDNPNSVAKTSRRAAGSLDNFRLAVDAATVALGGTPPSE